MPKKKASYPHCYISIPRDFNAADIQQALEAQSVKVTTEEYFDPKAFLKANYVIILLRKHYGPGYATIGYSQRHKKRLLAIQNSDYKNREWMDKWKIKRCVVTFKKTEQIVSTIMKFINSKGRNFRIA